METAINFLQTYSTEIFKQGFGNRIERIKKEKIKNVVREIKESTGGNLELILFKLTDKPLYEVIISLPSKELANSEDTYILRGIKKDELKNLYNELKKIWGKIKT